MATDSARSARPGWIGLPLVAALSLAAGLTSLANGFAYDDVHLILQNDLVHTVTGLGRHFVSPYWPAVPLGPEGRLYRPLTTIAFAIEWAAGGGAPVVFHAVSLLLSVGVCLLVFALARRLMPAGPAAFAAACFAVHPVHVEVVANGVGQGELLAAIPLLLAAVLYVDARRMGFTPQRTGWLLALYGLACLAKEHALLLPLLLLALEPALHGARGTREPALKAGLGMVAVAMVYLSVRVGVLGTLAGDAPHPIWKGLSLCGRGWTMLGVVPVWTRLLLWPRHLQADYAPREVLLATGLGTRQLAGLACVAGALVTAVMARRRAPVLTAGLLWLSLGLGPVSNIIAPTGIVAAERTLYLPSVGLLLALGALLAWGAPWLRRHRLELPLGAALMLILVLGLARSTTRNPVWRDNATLFGQTVRDAPLSYWAWRNWGGELVLEGREDEAALAYHRAIALYPGDPNVYDDLASLSRREGRCGDAVPLFRRSLEIDPERLQTAARLIGCLATIGDFDGARREAESRLRAGRKEFGALAALVDSIERQETR
jgi:hypothetical protein